MVLETLIGAQAAEKTPLRVIGLGFLYTFIAIILSLVIFRSEASMVMVFLTVLASVPLVYNTIRIEEETEGICGKRFIDRCHIRALTVFIFLFLGFVFAFMLAYVFMPHDVVDPLFDTQMKTIEAINSRAISPTASIMDHGDFFFKILGNNLKVLFFCLFFSFFYGAGAIFILTWNASVISAAIGDYVRQKLATVVGIGYFTAFSLGFFRYMTHGIFEIVAYFIGGLAGGIISVAVIRHEVHTEKFKSIISDSLGLILFALILLFLGALIETFITPVLFS